MLRMSLAIPVFALTFAAQLFALTQVHAAIRDQSHYISPKQAVAIAIEKSPLHLSAKNALESARLEKKNAFATFLPSLDLSSSYGFRGLNPDTNDETLETNKVSRTTLSLTETLYDNGENYKRNRIADYGEQAALINYNQTKAQVIMQAVLAYYRYTIALQNLKFTQMNFNELERLSKLVSNQFHQGLKTRKDFLSFKTRAQRGRLDVIDAENRVTDTRATLLATIGLSPDAQVLFDETVKPILPPGALSTDFDINNLPEMRTLDLQQKIDELQIALVRRQIWPELNLVGALSYGSSDYWDTGTRWANNDQSEWSVLLNLNFNILDWGVRSRNIRITEVNRNSLMQTKRIQLHEAQKDLEIFKLDVARSAERYKLSKELQKMEEDTFKLLERDYRGGQATYLELTTGLANLLDAQSRGQEANFDQASLYLRWKYYKGTLSENTIFQ